MGHIQIQTPEGNIDYGYGCSSKATSILKGTETLGYDYDGSLLLSETLSGALNQVLSYTYNNDFDPTSFSYAGNTVNYGYDNDGLLTGAGGFSITRNTENGLPEAVTDAAASINRTFNGYGELEVQALSVNSQSNGEWSVIRDQNGRISSKTEIIEGQTVNYGYTYDPVGRLLTVMKNGVLVEEYQYDANGRRTSETNNLRGISGRSFSYSEEDHIFTAGSTSYQFDVDGFLVSKTIGSDITLYNYSSRGELLRVDLPNGTLIEYIYDPLQRRIAKKINGTVVEKYLWQGLTRLLAVYDDSDNLLMRFEYADGRMPVKMTKNGISYYLLFDQVGTIKSVVDATGSAVKRIEYDFFGNVIADSNPTFGMPFGFAGGLFDRDTILVLFGYRDYDPAIGRWVAKDPIDFAGGDTNLYGYVQNDPINFIDPYGLWSLDIGFTGSGTGNAALNVGIQIGSTGAYAYYGAGLGGGAGLSATISTADPSSGVSVSGTARGGTGTWGAFGNVGVDSSSGAVTPSAGIGWGVGWGVSVGATHTFGFSWDEIKQKFNQLSQPDPLIPNETALCPLK